jgi:hypothetical protein
MNYPYDPDIRDYVAQLLYDAIPTLYKLEDERAKLRSPPAPAELEEFINILAAPLAIVRQSVEELYGDLFIDSAQDWVLPYLAQMVRTHLVFPDADSNRRDIRATIHWRRRKGTPAMLQDLGNELTNQLIVTQEGWQRIQLSQDLNILRSPRTVPRIRSVAIAEQVQGPLDSVYHAVDVRAISQHTGRYHPKHIIHWAHPTRLFPVTGGTPADLRDPATDPDFRFAFHPLALEMPLRCRRTSARDRLPSDRVPPMTFRENPGPWFGVEGRFDVHIAGLTAAVAASHPHQRSSIQDGAALELITGSVDLQVLDFEERRFTGAVTLAMLAVPLSGNLPDISSAQVRSRIDLDASGASAVTIVNSGALTAPNSLPMLRLTPVASGGRRFPGAVMAIAGSTAAAQLDARTPSLAQAGFLRGALVIAIPETLILGERWFYIAADGSLFEAQSTGTGTPDLPVAETGPPVRLVEQHRRSTGPGAAYPPLPFSIDDRPWIRLPAAPNAGPIIMHGGRALSYSGTLPTAQILTDSAETFTPAPDGDTFALSFAVTYFAEGRQFEPMLRLSWAGSDPAIATWSAIGPDGRDVDGAGNPIDVGERFQAIAQIVLEGRVNLGLVLRFESSQPNAVIAPAEIAFTAYDGRSVLIYTPGLVGQATNPDPAWPTDPARFPHLSTALTVGRDGSTWRTGTTINRRQALGAVAPLRSPILLQRRQVYGRSLCQWRNESPPGVMHAETLPGRLDIDVAHGLFSLNGSEPPQPYPARSDGVPAPASLSVTYQEGYSLHLGAKTEPREPALNERLPEPTRLVTASGTLPANSPPGWWVLPQFRSLGAALEAIAVSPQAEEVIHIVDNATYTNEVINWPSGPESLTIQAAERTRPLLVITSWNLNAVRYARLTFTGLAIHFASADSFTLPSAHLVEIRYCSILQAASTLVFNLEASSVMGNNVPRQVRILHSLTAKLNLLTAGELVISDSVIDTGTVPEAITVDSGQLVIERSTVIGAVTAEVIEASETIFMDAVTVQNRFAGCVRYSRVTSASILPRQHRLAIDTPVKFLSIDRHHPAHVRLAEDCDAAVLKGAEDGGEMGAFHNAQLTQRYEAYRRRLMEYTPAGLISEIVRMD